MSGAPQNYLAVIKVIGVGGGGVNAVKRAELADLEALSFLPDAVARAVYEKFHP